MDAEIRDLPISSSLDEICSAVQVASPVVLKAPPGAGKTTCVPVELSRRGLLGGGGCLLVQPRRLAARAAAGRIARLLDAQLGDRVGYQVRFENHTRKTTEITAMTTGILLRRLQSDPLLEGVSCVLLDEFHERNVEMDVALGMLQRIRRELRPELQLIVMSATLDPDPIVQFLGEACGVESRGRTHRVELRYCDHVARRPVDQQIKSVLPHAMNSSDAGHILVFLPGLAEIRRAAQAVRSLPLGSGWEVLDLYGDLPAKQQDAVFEATSKRKLILSTNVAETSVTIDGVTAVVDTGLARVAQFDPRVGLPRLQLEPISRASADQRAGRAGRTAPGTCFRLWEESGHRSRRAEDTPEILRSDLSELVLRLIAWGERDVMAFPWLTSPPPDAVAAGLSLLEKLGAINERREITGIGRQMLNLPLHSRLSRFLVAAASMGVRDDAALAAALLSERDPFRGNRDQHPRAGSGCDVLDRVEQLKSSSRRPEVQRIQRSADQLVRLSRDAPAAQHNTGEPANVRFVRSLLAAYPDRVARRRQDRSDRGVMVGGRGVRLDSRSGVTSGDLFLCIDVDSAGSEALVRSAATVLEQWLDQRSVREVEEVYFDSDRLAVVARRRLYYEDLILREHPIACAPGPAVTALLAEHAAKDISSCLPVDRSDIDQFVQRVRFLSEHLPRLELPPLADSQLESVLVSLCASCTSIDELRSAPWLAQLRGRYNYEQLRLIDKHAPPALTLPSGNSARIQYREGQPPVIEARIQELFGWKETPRIAARTVPVQLHLLGPNYRSQQITNDLSGFWADTYAHVRKELRGRYPKHHWPEDPLTARSTRNGLKPRG